MGWIKDLWLALLFAVAAAMIDAFVGYFRTLPSIIAFFIWFSVFFLAFALFTFAQKKILRRHLQIDKERWNKIREETIKQRRTHNKAKQLPAKLYELHKLSVSYMKSLRISKKNWDALEPDFKKIIGPIRLGLASLVLKLPMPIIARIRPVQNFVYKIIFDLDSCLKGAGIETLNDNPKYSELYAEINEIRSGLPDPIFSKVTAYILWANMLDMIYIFNASQPFMKKVQVSTKTKNMLPYLTLAVDTQLGKLNGQLTHDIERFLLGD